MRRLKVMKTLFTVLSLLENRGAFIPDREDFYSKTMEAFDISTSFSDMEPLRMKYDLSRYAEENSRLKAEMIKLKEEKEALSHEAVEQDRKIEVIEERVRKLESMTDNELDREIIRWVEDHSGKLHEEKFCTSFSIKAQRLEERLDALSKAGVIRIV
jgi:predicted RNase H-like nuclease (RuvC/YqgF family)